MEIATRVLRVLTAALGAVALGTALADRTGPLSNFPRGPLADWYPYPFLDPRPHGYDHVAAYGVVLALGMALLALVVHAVARWRDPA